ncbi:uncharacterized protein LOC113547914 isoform X1 [Rhopalosiphum maidis]|uniref:uncharacterized protein LOC113547914 isoform X1 n=1 Tax=Rhopalosiphum maidis TaxID=43146 RepID=UPI000F00F24E|nr:uncharacterized protein LOC113547914 isoform X1 [Rhopalosiphum maidis]
MKFLILFIFNIFTFVISNHIKLIPELCKAGDPFTVNHQTPTIHGILSALVNTNKKCSSNFSLLKVKRNGGIVNLEICYDEFLLKTIYVKFEIDGVSLKKFDSVIIPPLVTQNINLYPENVACFYTKNHQAALFKYIYNSEDAITDSSFLTEGHLASNSDFTEDYKQLGTFFYANITPQWKSINQHAWALIESAIRSYAIDTGEILEAYAGTHGQALTDSGQPLFLTDDGRVPVAAWLWKAVVDRSAGAGVAFVCRNDPSQRTAAAGTPCGGADVCADGRWNAIAVAGMSFCCTLQQLAETIPEAAAAIVGVDADVGLLKRPPPPPKSSESVTTAYGDVDDDDGGDEDHDDEQAEKND